MEVVAGLSLKNLKPRVWDPDSPHYLADLEAIMVSYADFASMPARRQAAMSEGLRSFLGVPPGVMIYLDNGSFYQLRKGGGTSRKAYEEFVEKARPDWHAIPQDFIPTPFMTDEEQLDCLRQTMAMNRDYRHDGYVPVIHISRHLSDYLKEFLSDEHLRQKREVALGGIVPNLLRAPKAMPYADVLDSVHQARRELGNRRLHVFGLGGTATMHLAALLGVDSADSAGWRNRAARGIVQLPGRGDRVVANLGNWRGREPDAEEWAILAKCPCPACQADGINGLKAEGLRGFCHRATHNLWTLLNEVKEVKLRLSAGTYQGWYQGHLDNSTYRPLIEYVLKLRGA
jgi:7-cyano-7-deazaguanine tRNA-ribosyltransferase